MGAVLDRCRAENLRDRVPAVAAGGGWVIDGNYSDVRPLIWERADTVVRLDYSFPVMFAGRRLAPCAGSAPASHGGTGTGSRGTPR